MHSNQRAVLRAIFQLLLYCMGFGPVTTFAFGNDTPRHSNTWYDDNSILRVPKSGPCSKMDPDQLSEKVVSFLKKRKLLEAEEKWYLVYITENLGKCYGIVMEAALGFGENPAAHVFEVVVIEPFSHKIKPVEETFKIPKKMRVGMAEAGSKEDSPHYVWEFTDPNSVLAAFKSVVSRVPYEGLEGCVDVKDVVKNSDERVVQVNPTGKLSWDPTPNRTWKFSRATYNLRRGTAQETDAIYAFQLDRESFFDYMSGSLPCPQTGAAVGHIAPWGGSAINLLFENNKWKKVDFDPRFLARLYRVRAFFA